MFLVVGILLVGNVTAVVGSSSLSKVRALNVRLSASVRALLNDKYDMVMWDCDGVLVDSEALLKKGEVDALRELGYELTTDDCTRLFSGVAVDQAMENFRNEMKVDLPATFFKEQIAGSHDLFRRELKPLMVSHPKRLFLYVVGV